MKLFVEEEDVTITFLIDASPSMASGGPEKLLFAKRAAAALGYIALASRGPRGRQPPCPGGRPAATPGSAARAGCSGCWATCRPSSRPRAPPTLSRGAPCGGQLSGRGVVVLLSDLLDPGADRVVRELAATAPS